MSHRAVNAMQCTVGESLRAVTKLSKQTHNIDARGNRTVTHKQMWHRRLCALAGRAGHWMSADEGKVERLGRGVPFGDDGALDTTGSVKR
jgi:hypothetical protein